MTERTYGCKQGQHRPIWLAGVSGDDYEARAVGAIIGIYGQNEKEAVYFSYQADAEGNPLDLTKTYELTFASQPEVTEFWSLTMFISLQRLLVDNAIGRYSIGDRTEGLILDGYGLTKPLPRSTLERARTGCRRRRDRS